MIVLNGQASDVPAGELVSAVIRRLGLDVDALRTVANGVTRLAGPDMSVLVITHYPRILEYLKPDRVHILNQGRVILSGGPELATQIEREGYEPIIGPVAAEAGASRTSLTGVVAEAQA